MLKFTCILLFKAKAKIFIQDFFADYTEPYWDYAYWWSINILISLSHASALYLCTIVKWIIKILTFTVAAARLYSSFLSFFLIFVFDVNAARLKWENETVIKILIFFFKSDFTFHLLEFRQNVTIVQSHIEILIEFQFKRDQKKYRTHARNKLIHRFCLCWWANVSHRQITNIEHIYI